MVWCDGVFKGKLGHNCTFSNVDWRPKCKIWSSDLTLTWRRCQGWHGNITWPSSNVDVISRNNNLKVNSLEINCPLASESHISLNARIHPTMFTSHQNVGVMFLIIAVSLKCLEYLLCIRDIRFYQILLHLNFYMGIVRKHHWQSICTYR